MENDFIKYLESKKTVDDRALNLRVWNEMGRAVSDQKLTRPLEVLELGGGVGTMFVRLLEHGVLPDCTYTLVDLSEENVDRAARYIRSWSQAQGYQVSEEAGNMILEDGQHSFRVRLAAADLFDFLALQDQQWDLLIAHALLDLLNLSSTLPKFFGALRPGGYFYFTINYDGEMVFEPPLDPELDERLLRMYNQTMDERMTDGSPSGHSRTGRQLFAYLREIGAEVLAAGSSDWVVFPGKDGYQAAEGYFLHFIINTIHQALTDYPGIKPDDLTWWVSERHKQIEEGVLICQAHQLDFFGIGPSE